MNKFWQLIINIRDFSYHWSVKQYDEERAASEYKYKVIGFISGYFLMLMLVVFQILFYFGLDTLPVDENDPWWMKLLAGSVILGLPLFLLSRFLLKKVEHIPISTEYSSGQYRKYTWIFWGGFLFGWFLAASVGMSLTTYLRGGEIHLFNLILNEGGHNRMFKEDFGL